MKSWRRLNWKDTLESTSGGDIFSTVAGMRVYRFTEKEFHHRRFLVIVVKLRENDLYFCRRLLGECFWFPATLWTYRLLYQQQINSVTAYCLSFQMQVLQSFTVFYRSLLNRNVHHFIFIFFKEYFFWHTLFLKLFAA